MKILLLKDVANVGQRHDIKEVNDGFARNFLFAKKLAVRATDERIKEMEAHKQDQKQKQIGE